MGYDPLTQTPTPASRKITQLKIGSRNERWSSVLCPASHSFFSRLLAEGRVSLLLTGPLQSGQKPCERQTYGQHCLSSPPNQSHPSGHVPRQRLVNSRNKGTWNKTATYARCNCTTFQNLIAFCSLMNRCHEDTHWQKNKPEISTNGATNGTQSPPESLCKLTVVVMADIHPLTPTKATYVALGSGVTIKYKVSGGPVFTFSLPGGRFAPLSPVSHATAFGP